ncbi:MAG: SAM-dependent DNA methyltransferase, partial [Lachnospiraceae bacterium]|nr:SAM-dependent DNA methyltransferase [Lachnospiraceae bacterium]
EMIAEVGEDALNAMMDDVFIGGMEVAKKHLKTLRESAKKAVEACDKKEKKQVQASWDEKIASMEEIVEVAKEAHWLYSKFGEGNYEDILGLCKIADIETIEGKGWSLTPGAYVGVAPMEDDGVDFEERMVEIHKELLQLQAESNELMDAISRNMKEMGL